MALASFANFVRFKLAGAAAALCVALAPLPGFATELYAYVGAGMRPPVEALIRDFEAETAIKVTAEYGGSGQLLARFDETQRGDLFIPGSTFFTDKLKAKDQVDYIKVLALHGPVLAVHPSKADQIKNFADLAKPGVKLGLGDPLAMALGRTADEILDASGVGDAVRKNVTARAPTVKQLTLYVQEGAVDAAIIGAADAAQNAGKFAVVAIPTAWFKVEYAPAAALKTSADPAAARRFVDYLASEKGLATFERFGFPRAPQQ